MKIRNVTPFPGVVRQQPSQILCIIFLPQVLALCIYASGYSVDMSMDTLAGMPSPLHAEQRSVLVDRGVL